MAKWADFVVSAIKKGSGLANISHVQIHEDLENGFGRSELIDKYELSSKIQNGVSFVTVHKKDENEWTVGDNIRTYVKNGEAYIRTDDNKVDGDNLGSMPLVDELEIVIKEVKKEKPQFSPSPKPQPKSEPELESEPETSLQRNYPKTNENDGDYEYEDSRRASLAKESKELRSNKSMPKDWTDKPTEKEIIHNEIEEIKQKSKQKESKEKEFAEYEKKYLEKFEKSKSKNKKLKEKLKEKEQSSHDARISRRLKLEKTSGKDYDKLLSESSKSEPTPEPPLKTSEKEDDSKSLSLESRISDVFKRVKSSTTSSSKIADDTRNFIRKKRVTTKPEPEPQLEPEPQKTDSEKTTDTQKAKEEYIEKMKKKGATLPKGYIQKTISASPHADEQKSEVKEKPKDDPKQDLDRPNISEIEAAKNEVIKKEREQHEKEIEEIKIQVMDEARKQAEKEAQLIRDKLQKEIDAAKIAQEQLRKEVEEIKLVKEKLEREESKEKERAEAQQLQKELEEAKAEKERLEREEKSSKNEKTDLASEIKKELENLRKELESVDDDDEK